MSENQYQHTSHTETQQIAQPVHITVTKNSRGNYQYEVSIHVDDEDEGKEMVSRIVAFLEEKYGSQNNREASKA